MKRGGEPDVFSEHGMVNFQQMRREELRRFYAGDMRAERPATGVITNGPRRLTTAHLFLSEQKHDNG